MEKNTTMQSTTEPAARISGRGAMDLTPPTRTLSEAAAASGDAASLLAAIEQRADWRETFYGMSDDPAATATGVGFLGGEGKHVRRTMTLVRVIGEDDRIGHVVEDGNLHAVVWTQERQPIHMGARCVIDGIVEEQVYSPLCGQWTMVQPGSVKPAPAT